jgi:hypothetical protein
MGWTFPCAASAGGDFNFDFNVSITEEQQRQGGVEYNYRRGGHPVAETQLPKPVTQFAAMCGTDAATFVRDKPGLSAFVREDGVVYHSYSAYARAGRLWGASGSTAPPGAQRDRRVVAPPRRATSAEGPRRNGASIDAELPQLSFPRKLPLGKAGRNPGRE